MKYTVTIHQDLAGYHARVKAGGRVVYGTGYYKTEAQAWTAAHLWVDKQKAAAAK